MLRPDHALFKPINAFVLQRATLDLGGLPLFYELFFSSESVGMDFRIHRTWMLRLIYTSLQVQLTSSYLVFLPHTSYQRLNFDLFFIVVGCCVVFEKISLGNSNTQHRLFCSASMCLPFLCLFSIRHWPINLHAP